MFHMPFDRLRYGKLRRGPSRLFVVGAMMPTTGDATALTSAATSNKRASDAARMQGSEMKKRRSMG